MGLPANSPESSGGDARAAERSRRGVRWGIALILLVGLGFAFAWWAKGRGYKTWMLETAFPKPALVTKTRPADGETGVLLNEFVAADVSLPRFNAGVDSRTLGDDAVKLYRTKDHRAIEAHVNTSAAGDSIVLQPHDLLDPGTQYTFEVTPRLRDTLGTKFEPFVMSFTTSSVIKTMEFPAAFEKVSLQHEDGIFTCLTFGPDHKLYASTIDGRIIRWNLNDDGTLADHPQTIQTILAANHGPRMVVGIRFDPASTPEHLILWFTHGILGETGVPDFTSALSRLSGANLEHYQDIVVGLPRAHKDHLCMQPDFGPDGCIYFVQGSNTGMGAPDTKWAMRPERILTAAMLRVDPRLIAKPPFDVHSGKQFDPQDPKSPVTIYATGIRLGFDTLWHSTGNLYTAVNGSAAHANTPASDSDQNTDEARPFRSDIAERGPFNSPKIPALIDVAARPDFLFKVEDGAYYGHPNPHRQEYVLDGGNPTAGVDVAETPEYPVGTLPDRNWRKPALIFGKNISPNGMIEYKSDAFGGALKGKILVTRYSGGDDVVALTVGADGAITEMIVGITGLRQFLDPLDLTEDARNGNLYVSEYRGSKITLMRPLKGALSKSAIILQIDPNTREPIR